MNYLIEIFKSHHDLILISTGFLLDLICGDPYWFPHPVRLIGKLINLLERALLKKKFQLFAGIVLTITTLAAVYIVTRLLAELSFLAELLIIYTIFATKSLAFEAKKIYSLLEKEDLPGARRQLSMLVSRDTDNLEEERVIAATIETVSENIVDAVTAPMFFLFLGGASLGMTYKAASTLDSMVGYKNSKYQYFGFASAKLDDILNFIPARITAFFIMPIAALIKGVSPVRVLRIVIRDRFEHSSPNSAHSEAAMAGFLGVRLGGEVSYFGKTYQKPTIGDETHKLRKEDILKSIKMMYLTAFVALLLCSVLKFISYYLVK